MENCIKIKNAIQIVALKILTLVDKCEKNVSSVIAIFLATTDLKRINNRILVILNFPHI